MRTVHRLVSGRHRHHRRGRTSHRRPPDNRPGPYRRIGMNHPASEPNPRLAGLDPEHLQTLLGLSRLVQFAAGEHVFREGDLARRLWLVQDGRVMLHTYVPGRGDVPIQTLGAGDVLGCSWLTAPHRWHFTATALSEARAREIDAAILHESSSAD